MFIKCPAHSELELTCTGTHTNKCLGRSLDIERMSCAEAIRCLPSDRELTINDTNDGYSARGPVSSFRHCMAEQESMLNDALGEYQRN